METPPKEKHVRSEPPNISDMKTNVVLLGVRNWNFLEKILLAELNVLCVCYLFEQVSSWLHLHQGLEQTWHIASTHSQGELPRLTIGR